MARVALVLGGSGNFGGRMAEALWNSGWEVRPYARGTDMAAAAQGASLIVNGLNPPGYHDWARLIPEITASVLAAGRASGATVLVPGNVYVYGATPGLWGVETPHRPVSRKGAIREEMEARYRAAAGRGQRVILLRGGDFVDPVNAGTIWRMVMLKGLARGRITAMGKPSVRRAYAWLPDMARAGALLAAMGEALPAFADVPFAGQSASVDDLAHSAAILTGRPMRVGQFPWWALRLASPFWELGRELLEMRYLYETDHALDPAPLQALLPDFRMTGLDEMVAAHLAPAAPLTAQGQPRPADGAMRSAGPG